MMLGAAFLWRRSIWLVAGVHFAWNAVEQLLGVPVSGHAPDARLFNVHSTGSTGVPTHVLVNQHPRYVEVVVANEGPTEQATESSASALRASALPAGGRGLAGLRECVRVLGGELDAGPSPDGWFTVRARIPSDPDPE